jgi:hypothetical protein
MNVRELIERYNEAWNAQDVDAIHADHHPEIVFHNHTADERAEGADAVQVGDDFAVCEWTATTGTREWDGVDVFPIRDGKIARKDVYSSSHRAREL